MADLKAKLTLNDKNFTAKLDTACKKAKNQLADVSKATKGLGSAIGGAAGGISNAISSLGLLSGPAMAGTAALAGLAAGFKDCVKNGAELELSLSRLRGLTGLAAESMGQVKDMAIQTGIAMNMMAKDVVDAYGVVGSKMPELLQSPEMLDQVTRAAATLGKAGVMPMAESVEALTGIMNQMNASAVEADDYINVLAAGSKNGAGNIQYLSDAFNKAGGAIRTAGMSVEQGTAAIEVLAKKIPDANIAGTQLSNVLLILSTQSNKDLNPAVVGINKALENLSKISGNASEMVDMFGRRNYTAAKILADEYQQVISLTDAVTGTSEAHDQAAVNTDNLTSQTERLKSAWGNLTAAIGESNGVLTTLIRNLALAIQGFVELINKRKEFEGTKNFVHEGNKDQEKFWVDRFKKQGMSEAEAQKRANQELLRETQKGLEIENKKIDQLYADRAKVVGKALEANINVNVNGLPSVQKLDHQIELAKKNIEDYKSEIDGLNKKINGTKTIDLGGADNKTGSKTGKGGRSGKTEPAALEGSLEWLNKYRDKIKKEFSKGLYKGSVEEFWKEYNDITEKIKDKEIELRFRAARGSYNDLQEQYQTLVQNQMNGVDVLPREQFEKKAKQLKDAMERHEIFLGIKPRPELWSELEKQMDEYIQNVSNGAIKADPAVVQKTIKDFQKRINRQKVKVGISFDLADAKKAYKELMNSFNETSTFDQYVKPEGPKNGDERLEQIRQTMDKYDRLKKDLENQKKDLAEKGLEGTQEFIQLEAAINNCAAALQRLGEMAQAIDEQNRRNEQFWKNYTNAADAVDKLGQSFSSLGGAFEAPELEIAGTIAQAIAQIALGAGAAIAQAGEMGGPLGWIAFGATIMAQLAAMIAQIHSITGYASGGIVGGGKYVGDKQLARLNSGEMVLNHGQQTRLWNILTGESTLGSSIHGKDNVQFVLRGSDLYGSINNYKKITKK